MKLINVFLSLFENDPERKAIRKSGIDPDRFYELRDAAERMWNIRREADWPEWERKINEIIETWPD